MKIEFERKLILRFIVTVCLAVLIACLLHVWLVTGFQKYTVVIYTSYSVQLFLSVSSFLLLSRISQKNGGQVGFYFLGLSMLKFLVYMLGFRFYFMMDGVVSKAEYAIFFVPYIIAFAIEIIYLVNVLNKAPVDLDKVIDYSEEEE